MRGETQKMCDGGTAMMFKFGYRYCILNLNGISVFAFVFGGEFESSAATFEKKSSPWSDLHPPMFLYSA